MNLKFVSLVLLFTLSILGCRREDVRDLTLSFSELDKASQAKVVEALSKYNGIKKESYQWDIANKTLSLRYDSMQIAQANIRYAISEQGVKVIFPPKTDERAGH